MPPSSPRTDAYPTIVKSAADWPVSPNLGHYEQVCEQFSWEQARQALSELPGGRGLNIGYEAVDRHADGPLADRVAIRWLGRDDTVRTFTYRDLSRLSSRFANVLAELGVEPGDRVYTLLPRVPELYVAALGAMKHRCIFCPLFSAFGPEPIQKRLEMADGRVLVTTAALYRRKHLHAMRRNLPKLEHVLVIGNEEVAHAHAYETVMRDADDLYDIQPTAPDDPALLHFTSGTTGNFKGALHVHEAVVMHHLTGRLALDMHEKDVYWCTADPGWVTGTSYGIIAPLTNGVTSIVDEAEFDAHRWYRILQDQKVSVWYTAPTAIRMLMRLRPEVPRQYDLTSLRFMASVGEPLNPEAVIWGQQTFGMPFHDNWWQTETGGIMIANYAAMDVRAGSMGRPMPGIEAQIVRRDEAGHVHLVREPNVEGELAIRAGWPSMFRGIWNDPERYEKCFADGFYLTNDLARRDREGYFWFVGRKDDVIKTAGHLVGPFEVESALIEHPAVAEVGVIGKPDPAAGEIVKAFVVLADGRAADDPLRRELIGFARTRLGATIAPREIAFVDALPKTRSGKIMRRLLKARELGLPEGDLSVMEQPA